MPIHELVMTSGAFADIARRLSGPGCEQITLPCGLSRMPDRWQWLVSGSAATTPGSPLALFARGTHPEVLADTARMAAESLMGDGVALALGVGPAAGHLAGAIRVGNAPAELAAVRVIAPGLPRITFGAGWANVLGPDDRARFSRTIGALGEAAFARLKSPRFAVVGCGRLGSLAAEHLASLGVAGLALIDPDVMEPHNFGEMAGDLAGSLGRPKVRALAEGFRRRGLGTEVSAVEGPAQSLVGLFALKAADIVVCCPDNPEARRATAGGVVAVVKYVGSWDRIWSPRTVHR